MGSEEGNAVTGAGGPSPDGVPVPEPTVDAVDLGAIVQRVYRMQGQLLRDTSDLLSAAAMEGDVVAAGFDRLQTTFAMVAKSAATTHVKIDDGLADTRRLLVARLESLEERLARDMLASTVEKLLLAVFADVVQDADAVLASATGDGKPDPALNALRLIRDKLLAGLRPYGVESIPLVPGTSRFDDELHECVGLAGEPNLEPGVVSDVTSRGYTLGGRVVRRARVFVKGE